MPLSALFQLYGGGQCHFQHYFSYMVAVSATFSTISVIWWWSVPLSALFQLYGGGQCHFQHYFSYMVTVSFIGGGNQSAKRKPQT
jgi:hypothetical protein